MRVLITGVAGFIGMHTAIDLLKKGNIVVGVDNVNDYYDVALKKDRLKNIALHGSIKFFHLDVADAEALDQMFLEQKIDKVIHLAAQAGVRYSIENPHAYAKSNLIGFLNILECCRKYSIEHLVYASSSSVYGGNKKVPFSEDDSVDHPVSFYAATKKSNELMAHTYSHLFNVPTTGLRFFTVYGPWGRPDMAPFLFVKAILAEHDVKIFNFGKMRRDFTFIDDIVKGVVSVLDAPFDKKELSYRILNLGNSKPVELMKFISLIEAKLGKTAHKKFLPMQDGDVVSTFADSQKMEQLVGFSPSTSIESGVDCFVDWYRSYYRV